MEHQYTPKPKIYKTHPWISQLNPPLANAPMLNIATAPLATSVSSAGGIGFITGGYDTTLSGLETNLHHATQLIQALPDADNPARNFYTETGILPLGVGFINWGVDREEAFRILAKYKVAAVWLFAPKNMPEDLMPWVNDLRVLYQDAALAESEVTVDETTGQHPPEKSQETFHHKDNPKSTTAPSYPQIWLQIGSVAEATAALDFLHPDVLVIQGSDAGGHGLAHSASLITLLPEILSLLARHFPAPAQDEHPTLLAAGGLTTGRTLSAALLLGATGGVMGTRFLASHEAHIAPGYQAAILRAVDGGVSTIRSTVYDRVRGIHGWPGRYDGRGVVNASYMDAVGGMGDEENRKLYVEEMGKGDAGWDEGTGRMTTYAGTGVGLVGEVLEAREILREVWGECKVVSKRGGRL